jgi:hypothetical protein
MYLYQIVFIYTVVKDYRVITREGFLLGSNDTTGHKNHNIEYSHHAGIIQIEKLLQWKYFTEW